MPGIKISEDRVLLTFVDQLITSKGLNLDKQARRELRVQLKAQLDNAINEAMIAALPDAQLLELEKKVNANASDDEIEKVFEAANIDYDAVAKKTLEDFRDQVMAKDFGAPVTVETPAAAQPEPTTAAPVAEATSQPEMQQPVVSAQPVVPVQPVTAPVQPAEQPVAPAQQVVTEQPVAQPVAPVQPVQPAMQQPVASQPAMEQPAPAQPVVPQSTMTDQNTQAQQIEQAINNMNAINPAAGENYNV